MKHKASEFMGRSATRHKVEVPTLAVSRRVAASHSASSSSRRTVYGVDSLEKALRSFDENERALRRDMEAS